MSSTLKEHVSQRSIWFKGERVSLTGEVEHLHGGVFYIGVYTSGHLSGRKCWIAESIARRQLEEVHHAANV